MSRPTAITRIFAACAAACVAGPLTAAPPASAYSTVSGLRLNAFEARLVRLINDARTSRGIPALTVAAGTTDVARRWSATQAGRNTMSHNPSLGSDVAAAGSSNWTRVAENVGHGGGTNPDAMFSAYMSSASHRNNLLNSTYRYLGMGWAERADGTGFNTQVFVDQYSSAYGRTRQPAFGAVLDKRAYSASGGFADFESGWDPRVIPAATASGLSAGSVVFETPADGDQAVRFTAKQTGSGTGGAAELRLRDAVDLTRATAFDVRLGASTGTGKALTVDVYVRREWGDAVKVGSVTIPSGRHVVARFTLPAGARSFRNVVAVSVSRTALAALNPAGLSGRSANVYVRYVSVVV